MKRLWLVLFLYTPMAWAAGDISINSGGTGSLSISQSANPTFESVTAQSLSASSITVSTITASSATLTNVSASAVSASTVTATMVNTSSMNVTSAAVFSGSTSIKGTATNNNAATGYVGEYLSSSTVNHTTSDLVWVDEGQLDLTAGDWDITAVLHIAKGGAADGIVNAHAGISVTPGDSSVGLSESLNYVSYVTNSSGYWSYERTLTVPNYRVQPTAPTTYYLKAYANIAGGTGVVYTGRLSARRFR